MVFKTLLLKGAKGDKGDTGSAEALPTDSVVGWDGGEIPDGYEETTEPVSWIKKVATTPLETVAKVIDSLTATNKHTNAPSINAVQQGLADLQNNINNIWEAIYPVGALYMSANATNPATLFGGTWEQIKEKFILSAGDTHTAGSTGGAWSKTVNSAGHSLTTAELPSHTHPSPNISASIASSGAHTHTYAYPKWYGEGTGSEASENGSGWVNYYENYQTGNPSGTAEGAHTHAVTITKDSTTGATGSGTAHNHSVTVDVTSPYLAVYVWKRTA